LEQNYATGSNPTVAEKPRVDSSRTGYVHIYNFPKITLWSHVSGYKNALYLKSVS